MRSVSFVLVCSLAMLASAMRKDMTKDFDIKKHVNKEEITAPVDCACKNKWGRLVAVGADMAKKVHGEAEKADQDTVTDMCEQQGYHVPLWFKQPEQKVEGEIQCSCNPESGTLFGTKGGADNFGEMRKAVFKAVEYKVKAAQSEMAKEVQEAKGDSQETKKVGDAHQKLQDKVQAAKKMLEDEYGVIVEVPAKSETFEESYIKSFDHRTPEDMKGKKWACCCVSGDEGECQSNVEMTGGWLSSGMHHEAPAKACKLADSSFTVPPS